MKLRRILLGGLLFALVAGFNACKRATAPAAEVPAQPAATHTAFDRLLGRWERPDGGYVLELRAVDAAGRFTAGYFNPSPIQVEKAEAREEGGQLKVFVVLRDVNYPGCTYLLTYEPQRDLLFGEYYQAAMQQTYEVAFTRLP